MSSSLLLYSSIEYGQEYDKFMDSELIEKIIMGNDQAENCLLKRYFYLIRRIMSSFYIIGCGKDDILQESMIGLFKAMKSYDKKYNKSFKTYAELCIRRQIISVIRKSKSYENKSVFIFERLDDDNALLEQLSDDYNNPEDILLFEEDKNSFSEFATIHLSEYEKSVINEYCNGKTYKEIAENLNRDIKSIDNALQRVKKKIDSRTYLFR